MDIKRHFDTYGKRPRRCVPLRLTEAFSATDERITWALMQGATSFNVEESTNGGAMWQLVASGGTGTDDTYLPDNLTADTTYLFRVQAVNANGGSPYSPAVSMTTGTTASWANYFSEAPGLGPISSGLDTTFSLSSTNATVYAPSWQNAMLTQLSGAVGVPQLGINYTIGDFSSATTGNGDFGASGVLLMPSLSPNSAEMGVNNNYADLRSNPNQNDNPPTGSINELENAPGDQGQVFNQKEAENMDQGGYLLLNSNDYDYRLTSGNALIPASSQTDLSVAEYALQQVRINAENPTSAGGIYTLTTTGGLQLWLDDQKQTQVTASYTFNATQSTVVYIEGTQIGEGSIALNWQKNATAAPQLLDTVYYNVWAISGPQNVPGNGKYSYNFSGVTGFTPHAGAWQISGGADIAEGVNQQSVQVLWGAGDVVGNVDLNIGDGFSGQWNVNVVEIKVTPGSPTGNTYVPGTAAALTSQYAKDFETAYVPGNDLTKGNISVATVKFNNMVTMTGPNGGWGDQFMRIGYVQNLTFAALTATYSNNGTPLKFISSVQGSSYLDLDTSVNQASTTPWADSQNATGFAYWGTNLTNSQKYMSSYDSPVISVPSPSPVNMAGEPVGAILTAFNVSLDFTTYIAVETVDPETQPAYVDLAQFSWQTNYSASTVNGSLQLASGSGFSPAGAGAFTLATPGSFVPITSGTPGNNALNSETWS
jgi:hypothetical protein